MSRASRPVSKPPYLLDTHIWLWVLASPEHLAKNQRKALADASEDLWLSAVSIWELGLLVARGRVELDPDLRTWTDRSLEAVPVREVPLTREVALAAHELPFNHRDPADRFLAATALVYELTLVTADARLRAARWLPTL